MKCCKPAKIAANTFVPARACYDARATHMGSSAANLPEHTSQASNQLRLLLMILFLLVRATTHGLHIWDHLLPILWTRTLLTGFSCTTTGVLAWSLRTSTQAVATIRCLNKMELESTSVINPLRECAELFVPFYLFSGFSIWAGWICQCVRCWHGRRWEIGVRVQQWFTGEKRLNLKLFTCTCKKCNKR